MTKELSYTVGWELTKAVGLIILFFGKKWPVKKKYCQKINSLSNPSIIFAKKIIVAYNMIQQDTEKIFRTQHFARVRLTQDETGTIWFVARDFERSFGFPVEEMRQRISACNLQRHGRNWYINFQGIRSLAEASTLPWARECLLEISNLQPCPFSTRGSCCIFAKIFFE